MRILIIVLFFALTVPLTAQAQTAADESKRRYYNSQGQYGSQIYNSQGSYGRGPLSLNQILQGRENAADGSKNSYYGGYNNRPYGIDNNSYSLALSPDEVRRSRAQRDALARKREQETLYDLQRQANALYLEDETDSFRDTFQPRSNTIRRPVKRKEFKPREKGFDVPKKVFNSVY